MTNCSEVIQLRHVNPKKKHDHLLQLLIDANYEETDVNKFTINDEAQQEKDRKSI